MVTKVIITPTIHAGCSLYLAGVYKAKSGVMRVLTQNDEVEDIRDIKQIPKAKGYWFTKTMPELVIEYEDDENISKQNPIAHIQNMRNKRKVDFYAGHVDFTVNGKPHANSVKFPNFNMTVYADKVKEEHELFRDSLLVRNRLNSMSYEEKCAVADYYGVTPKGKTETGLLIELAGDKGICIQPKNMKTFLREWMNPSEDTIMIVNIKKAIRLGVIETRNSGGRIDYYLGTTSLGTQVEDVIAYCRQNPEVYKAHILRKINEDLTVEERATDKESEGQKEMSANDIADLRNEAQQLKKEGFIGKMPVHNMKYENLLPLVEEARKKKEASLAIA